jgi:hypothetical protein
MMDQYGMEMEYGQEHDGMMMDHHDGYGPEMDDGEGNDSLNFDENPEYSHLPKLDRMRKIRREVMKTINDIREGN